MATQNEIQIAIRAAQTHPGLVDLHEIRALVDDLESLCTQHEHEFTVHHDPDAMRKAADALTKWYLGIHSDLEAEQ